VLKPKERINRRSKPGKGKFGRVNANEPLTRLREVEVIEKRVETMMNGSRDMLVPPMACEDTKTPEHRGHPPRTYLFNVKLGNPNEVSEVVDLLSRPTAREAEFLSGNGKDQKAKAASRKAIGRHN